MWYRHVVIFLALLSAPESLAQVVSVPDRESLAALLREAEQQRACYRLKAAITYHYEVDGVVDRRIVFTRLSDGGERFRREKWGERPGEAADSVELSCWDGETSRADLHGIGSRAGGPHTVGLAAVPAGNDYLDEIENVLGLGIAFQVSDRTPRLSPSDALLDRDTSITIEPISLGGRDLVRVRIVGPWGGKGNAYIYDFDPQRQWLVSGVEVRVYQDDDQRKRDESRYIMSYSTVQAEQIGGVWMPRKVDMLTRMADRIGPEANWEEYRATLRLDAIDLDPQFSDADFRFTLDGMPDGTIVIDNRLGVSYKLGQNLIYVDGLLHKTPQAIAHEITATELSALLASATPLVDPELERIGLKDVRGNGLAWAGRLAAGVTACILLTIGVLAIRRRLGAGGGG